jgi:hypothetical protein
LRKKIFLLLSGQVLARCLMRIVIYLSLLLLIGLAGFWSWINFPQARNRVIDFLHSKNFKTLEVRYSAESIMEAHRKELLKDGEHIFLEPSLKFHPYLLMQVKYSSPQDQTGEGMILWSLIDGEMVINTSLWEKTHGFSDCINAGADKSDYKIIKALSSHNNYLDRESLKKTLNIEDQTLSGWLENCQKKNLIVQQSSNNFRLHFQNPRLNVNPETKIDQWLVTKQFKNKSMIPEKYRASQIEYTAKAAFGTDFAIRKTTEVYLPVYSIVVQNPDGSLMTTYWNALNGKKLPQILQID